MSRHGIDISERLDQIANEKGLERRTQLQIDNMQIKHGVLIIDVVEARS